MNPINLWYWFRRHFILVRAPKTLPKDTIIVLTVYKNRVTGWQRPGHHRDCWFARGASFVCLTQDDIDHHIPPQSRHLIEEAMEQFEWDDRQAEREELALHAPNAA